MRILATFVLAFICLNAGGFFCLTYCAQTASARPVSDDSHLSEHCRRAKKEAAEKDRNSTKLDANAASCCMMPVSMFAVPIEKQTRIADVVIADSLPAVSFEFYKFSAPVVVVSTIASTPVYRPPPLDHRVERILHSIFRI